jgi:hypothetical protein
MLKKLSSHIFTLRNYLTIDHQERNVSSSIKLAAFKIVQCFLEAF